MDGKTLARSTITIRVVQVGAYQAGSATSMGLASNSMLRLDGGTAAR
jgi:hypothetical protein